MYVMPLQYNITNSHNYSYTSHLPAYEDFPSYYIDATAVFLLLLLLSSMCVKLTFHSLFYIFIVSGITTVNLYYKHLAFNKSYQDFLIKLAIH